jgi:HEAT repeat protein
MSALVAVAPIRTYRHRLAAEIVPLLAGTVGEGRDVPALAARILGQLRSPVAIPALIPCLEREDKDLRVASWAALKEITAQSLPFDAGAWRAAFPSR